MTRRAAELLGKRVRLGRRQRRWTLDDLAERVGVSRLTIGKVEQGDLSVAVGTVLEAAVLTGVPLFDDESSNIRRLERETELDLALLPRQVRRKKVDDDDF